MSELCHCANDLELIFQQCFAVDYNTQLVGGANEPLYRPADDKNSDNKIFYRENFFSSALHEVAHWCIASNKRRQLLDFGYWYDGSCRNNAQQAEFQSVELVPQAIELLFSQACHYSFEVSIDNFSVPLSDITIFDREVKAKAKQLSSSGLPDRAAIFLQALTTYYTAAVPIVSL